MAKLPDDHVAPATRAEWRAWLRANHRKSALVWLLLYKKHTGKQTLSYDAAVEEALCYGWIDSILRRVDEDRYVQKFTPRKPASNWSASNKRRVAKLLAAGKMTRAGKAAVEVAKANGRWQDETAAATELPCPEELTARLADNAKARAFFEQLAPSYQRQYIGWIGSAKRPATRARRADEAVATLARGDKLGMK